MDIWTKLIEAAREGKAAHVTLTPGSRIHRVKRRKAGRPHSRGPVIYADYVGYDSSNGRRPRCAFRGCCKYLRKDQVIACSVEHEKHVVEEAQRTLSKVNYAST